jgi:Stage II sporulation protein E (SpoIIE)
MPRYLSLERGLDSRVKFARGIRFQALLLTAVPLAFLLLLLSLTGLLTGNSARSGAIAQHSAESLGRAGAVMQTLTDGNRSLAFFSKTHQPADERKWVKTPGSVRRQAANLMDLVHDDPAVRGAAARYVAALNRAVQVMSAFYADVRAGRPDLERALVAAPATQRAGAELTASKALFDRTQQAQTLARLRDERDALHRIEIILTAVALTGSIATIAVLARFGFHIVRRLELLAGNARRIALGEPTVDIAGSDEIAMLDGVYRRMTARMLETHHEREAAVAALERERNVAATLQKALLPNRLPEIPGLRFDAAYVTPFDGPEIGGDWFDVFPLDERHVGLSVGDVSGHGLRAAVTMGAGKRARAVHRRFGQSAARLHRGYTIARSRDRRRDAEPCAQHGRRHSVTRLRRVIAAR